MAWLPPLASLGFSRVRERRGGGGGSGVGEEVIRSGKHTGSQSDSQARQQSQGRDATPIAPRARRDQPAGAARSGADADQHSVIQHGHVS